MKRSELFFNLASIPTDIVSLAIAAVMSFYIRVDVVSRPIYYHLTLRSYALFSLSVLPGVLIIFACFGLYNLKNTRKFATEFGKIVAAFSLALLVMIVIFFFKQTFFESRFIMLAVWGSGIIVVTVGRYILKLIQTFLLSKGYGLHKLAIVDGPKSDRTIVDTYESNPRFGYKVISVLEENPELLVMLEDLYVHHGLEEILQANPYLDQDLNLKLVTFARNNGLNFSFVPNFFDVQRNVIDTETVNGLPVISLKNTPLDGWGKIVKRVFDGFVSLLALIVFSPVFLLIAIAIRIDSRGKILYAAPRGGHRRDFTFYKFRTMYSHMSVGDQYGGEDAEKMRLELWKVNARGGESGPFLKIKDDPRVTRVGRFLRKTKLDEVPQFLNVLRGDMSLVGPRAHVIDEVNRYRDSNRRLFSIKPGIFGVSQIAQLSWPDLPFEEEVRLNTYYIENWSLWLDIGVLFKSFWQILFGKAKNDNY